MKMKSVLYCSVAVLGAVPSAAFGQEIATAATTAEAAPEDTGFGAIVVTAQRREQKMQDVGVSVTAVTGSALRALGVADSKDIAKIAPGVVFDSSAGGSVNALLTIRGVSQSDFSYNQESPNSIYLDEVYNFSVASSSFGMFDLDRVEILRGPQGTLFGRASSGGLANFVTRRPTNDFNAYVEAGYGSFDEFYAEAAVGGALSDRVRARVSGKFQRSDGWFKNAAPGGQDTFEQRFFGLRGQVEADLTDTLKVRLQVEYGKNPKHNEGVYKPEPYYLDAQGQPAPLPADVDAHGTGPGNDFYGYRDTIADGQTGAFNNVGYLARERVVPTAYVTWDIGDATVSSITNFTHFKMSYNEDCDGTPIAACEFPTLVDTKQWSQELRVNGKSGPLNYTAGVYYLDIDTSMQTSYIIPVLSGTDFAFSNTNSIAQRSKTFALFGQLEYKLTDKLNLTGGVRWTHETKNFDSKLTYSELGNGYSGGTGSTVYDPPLLDYDFSPATVGNLARSKVDMWSGKLALDYKPTSDMLLYASASRGVKGPGFNTNVGGTLTAAQTPFGKETIYAYEVGSKNTLLDNHLILNASAFYYDYHGFQGFAFAGLQSLVANYDGHFYGGEVELRAKLPEHIELTFGAAYLKSKLKDVPTAYNGVRDQESIQAPRWTINGVLSKKFMIGDGEIVPSWSFDYVAKRYASIDNNAATFLPSSFVHNARIAYRLPDQGLEVAAFVNNISNVDRENFVYDYIAFTGSVIKSYAKPRWWGISLRKEW